jgi:hypothetical protein
LLVDLFESLLLHLLREGFKLFVIEAWIIIYFGRNPRNGGSPPKDNRDVNIMNFISVISLFVLMVWLMNDTPDNLTADTTVSTSVE